MELNFNDAPTNTVPAGDIARGDLFKLPTGKTAYMRIHNPHKAKRSYDEDISVVNLATGYSYEFSRSKSVIPLCGVADVSMDDC